MAEIKIYRSETQRVTPQTQALGLRAPDLGIVGRAVSQFGQALGSAGEERAKLAAATKASQQHKLYRRDMLDIERAAKKMNPADSEGYYTQAAEASYNKHYGNLPTKYSKALFADPAGETRFNSRSKFFKENDARLILAGRAASDEEAQNYSRQASDLTGTATNRMISLDKMFGKIDDQENNGWINPVDASKRRNALAKDTLKNILTRKMQTSDSPMEVVNNLLKSDDPIVRHLIEKHVTGTELDKFVREQRATAISIENFKRQQEKDARATERADRAAAARGLVKRRDAAHRRYFDMIYTMTDPTTGEAVSYDTIVKQIRSDDRLKPFGEGSANALIKMIRLAEKGKDTEEQDASRRGIQKVMFNIATTGKDANGQPVTSDQFRAMALSQDVLEIFGLGSANTLISMFNTRLKLEAKGLGGVHGEMLRMLVERTDSKGNALTSEQIKRAIMSSTDLKPVEGAGSKRAFLDMLRLYEERRTAVEKGKKSAADAAAERDTQIEMYNIATTGKDANGKAVSLDAFRKQLLSKKTLAVFGKGSAHTLIGVYEARTSGKATASTIAQEKALLMVVTRKDRDGNDMTTTEVNSAILQMPGLKPTGTGSKAAFLKMVVAGDQAMMAATTRLHQEDALTRIHLPKNDPRHLTPHQLQSPEWVARLGFNQARQLANDAEGLLNEQQKPVIEAMKALFDRFKSTITNATLTKPDGGGDELFGAFQQHVRRVIQKAADNGEDPMEYFDDSNKKYLGNIVRHYIRPPEKQKEAMRQRFRNPDAFVPYTSRPSGAEPVTLKRLPGESTSDYLNRIKAVNDGG